MLKRAALPLLSIILISATPTGYGQPIPPKAILSAMRRSESSSAVGAAGGRAWMLKPETFDRLSAGGRRLARTLNGLVPSRPISPQIPKMTARTPLAVPAPRQNVRVNDPAMDQVGHTSSESSIAVRGSQIIVGFNDASADTVAGYGISSDAGGSFTQHRLPPPVGGGTYGDPVVAFGPNGEVYYSTLTVNESGYSSVGLSKSTDGGATFSPPADVAWTVANPYDAQDKDWMTVDTSASSPRKGTIYVSWTYFASTGETAIAFTRSIDGGASFDPAIALSPVDGIGVQNSVLAVAPNGDLYLAYEDGHARTSTTNDGITVVKSTDGGLSWRGPYLVASFNALTILTGGGGVRASSYPTMAVDGKGVLQLAWAAPSSGATTDRSDIFYSRSTDGGATYATPRKLNDDGTSTTQAFPSLAAVADGSVAVKWADRRNDAVNDSLTDVYMIISRDGGTTWGKNFRITDHNWAYGPIEQDLPSGYHGDYDGLAADGSTFFLSWSDERGTDPDVYFALVPFGFDPGTPDFNISSRQPYGTVTAGQQVSFDLATTSASNGFAGALALSVGSLPAGLSASLSSSSIPAGQAVQLTISTSSTAGPGEVLVPVTATAGGLSRTTNVHLVVYPAGRAASPPSNVSATSGFTAGAGVIADPGGTLHAVYEDDTAAVLGNDIYYRRSTDAGKTFSVPRKLNPSGSAGTGTAIAVDGAGRVVTVWAGANSGDSALRLFVARSTDGGASFSAATAVTPISQSVQYPVVAIDRSGNVIAAYFDASQSVPPLMTVRSTNGGGSFGSPAKVPDGSTAAITRPGLAFDSKGTAYIVYTQQGLTPTTLTSTARISTAGPSGVFTSLHNVSDPNVATAFAPDIAVGPDDSLYVTFYYRFGSSQATWNREVVVARSTDSGKTFGPYTNVSKNPGQSYFPTIAVESNGAVDVVWEDDTGNTETDVFVARSVDGGKTFTPPFNVSANPGLSGSASNAFEGGGGSGRAAVSATSGGNLLVSWSDDSPFNSELLAAVVNTGMLQNRPPTASITAPSPGFTVEAGVPVAFAGAGTDPDGNPITFSWTFGDGTGASGAVPAAHPYARPGAYTAVLTVADPAGASASASLSVTVTSPIVSGASLVVPVVLESAGLSGAFYTSEITLVSRSSSPTDVLLRYTASVGEGTGFARITLGPGEQRTIPNFILWLRGQNLPIPGDGSPQVGTLVATFGGAAGPPVVFAAARTSTIDPSGGPGSFGLFYTAAVPSTSTVTLFGLQENEFQRSNVAVVNAGSDPVTLRVALQGPAGEDLGTLPDQPLGPWGWTQLNQPLAGKATSGRAVVTLVSGSGPFTAYAVLNDTVTSDGSFLPPIVPGDSSGADRLVPIVLDVQGETARYQTELTLTNFSSSPLPLTIAYRAATGFGTGSGSATLTLSPGEQRIVPDAIAFLRGSLPIEPEPLNVAGSLLVKTPSGTPASALAAGARTFVPLSPSGTFGLFYTGLTLGESASFAAWVYGLQENDSQRSNLAIVNRGDTGDTVTLEVTWFSSSGAQLGIVHQTLAPGEWFQFNRPLQALEVTSGYASVELVSGTSRFAAYGVLNDNVTSDGSYVPMSR